MTETPGRDWDSMCSRFETVVVEARSTTVTIRRSMSCGGMPVYVQIIETTGMSMTGKTSVGVRLIVVTPSSMMTRAITINVYFRLSASLTIHMGFRTPTRDRAVRPLVPTRGPALKCPFWAGLCGNL